MTDLINPTCLLIIWLFICCVFSDTNLFSGVCYLIDKVIILPAVCTLIVCYTSELLWSRCMLCMLPSIKPNWSLHERYPPHDCSLTPYSTVALFVRQTPLFLPLYLPPPPCRPPYRVCYVYSPYTTVWNPLCPHWQLHWFPLPTPSERCMSVLRRTGVI